MKQKVKNIKPSTFLPSFSGFTPSFPTPLLPFAYPQAAQGECVLQFFWEYLFGLPWPPPNVALSLLLQPWSLKGCFFHIFLRPFHLVHTVFNPFLNTHSLRCCHLG